MAEVLDNFSVSKAIEEVYQQDGKVTSAFGVFDNVLDLETGRMVCALKVMVPLPFTTPSFLNESIARYIAPKYGLNFDTFYCWGKDKDIESKYISVLTAPCFNYPDVVEAVRRGFEALSDLEDREEKWAKMLFEMLEQRAVSSKS